MNKPQLVPLLLVGFVVWRMYYRLRRNIGRQPLQPNRMVARIVILALVTCVLTFFSLAFPGVLLALGCGFAAGVLLAFVGLHMTKFEATSEGHFYTPNSYIGIGLTLLLIGRVIYRLMILMPNMQNPGRQPQLMSSPLSLLVFALLAGYYIAYYIGVLMRDRALTPTNNLSAGASSSPR